MRDESKAVPCGAGSVDTYAARDHPIVRTSGAGDAIPSGIVGYVDTLKGGTGGANIRNSKAGCRAVAILTANSKLLNCKH